MLQHGLAFLAWSGPIVNYSMNYGDTTLVGCPNDGFTGAHDHIVIPAKAGTQSWKPGFRIKSGMTDPVKLLLRHYTGLE